MASDHQRIREMVRAAVTADPDVKNRVLLERAREIAPEAVEGLTLSQFHGKYRLPIARSLPTRGTRARRRRKPGAASATGAHDDPSGQARRDAVRDILRRFAVQLSTADTRSEIVRAAARIDAFVDEVLRATVVPPRARTAETRSTERTTSSAEKDAEAGEAKPERSAEMTPPPAKASEPAPRDMRPRRRPKAALTPPRQEETPSPPPAAESREPPSNGSARPPEASDPEKATRRGLTQEWEEFRKSREERERTRRPAP